VCATDSACAAALYAVYAEGLRPDLAVVPEQHLWDATVTRRLVGVQLRAAERDAAPGERRGLAEARVAELLRWRSVRPLHFERLPAGVGVVRDPAGAPFWGAGDVRGQGDDQGGVAFAVIDRLALARFGERGPSSRLERELWSSAYGSLGEVAVRLQQVRAAVAAWQRAVELTPERAAARSNLGVAYELNGEFERALAETVRAVELGPDRPTPWVNLARLSLRLRGPTAAQAALTEAQRHGIIDERLDAVQRQIAAVKHAYQGTTRK
jgi:tetratricopeptide (TPR) repeat protein